VFDARTTEVLVAEFPTPFARIDPERLHENVGSMQRWVAGLGAQLRPHFKTHRSAYVAQLQLAAGAVGFTCSDIAQLNTLIALDVRDIFVSSPIQVDPATWPVLRRAAATGRVTFAVTSPESVRALATALGAGSSRVWVEIDVGCHRTGVAPSACLAMAEAARAAGLAFDGIFGYPGHSYHPGDAQRVSDQERELLDAAVQHLERGGVTVAHVSAGSTPTIRYAAPELITEYRPGTYVLGDRQQIALSAIGPASVALTVTATVLASDGGRVVLDAGAKSLGRDAPPWLNGHGTVGALDGPTISRMYDHHTVVDEWSGRLPAVGDRLEVHPNNANSTLALQSAVILAGGHDSVGRLAELVHDT
jgi:D-serine deaminase-like pyridoxal phosphate-dependent protein